MTIFDKSTIKDSEQEFTLKIEVHMKSFGRKTHRVDLAQRIKRVLSLVQADVKVFVIDQEGTCNDRVLIETQRTDRNASASFDAGPTDADKPKSVRHHPSSPGFLPGPAYLNDD